MYQNYLLPYSRHLIAAHTKNHTDKAQAVFISGKNKQVSCASQAWMILSGVATKSEGAAALWKAAARYAERGFTSGWLLFGPCHHVVGGDD